MKQLVSIVTKRRNFDFAQLKFEAQENEMMTRQELIEKIMNGECVGADLRSADLKDTDLSGADLRGANLSGADLRGADLRSAGLGGAGLSGADLIGADLRCADLSGADLNGAILSDADLSSANLSGADLRGANLDFSTWPLWCGSKHVNVDEKFAMQYLGHFCVMVCDDKEVKQLQSVVLEFAKRGHRATDLGLVKQWG